MKHVARNRRRISLLTSLLLLSVLIIGCGSDSSPAITQFVFTSDPHYGISRDNFPVVGAPKADAHTVNAAMVAVMNTVPSLTLPCNDNGVNACRQVGAIDFVANTGDIANRMETSANVQSAAASWTQFETDYINGLSLKDRFGARSPVYIVPGNHDVTNAIGYYKPMNPLTDATPMAKIYNLFMNPSTQLTKDTYDYTKHKVYYSRDINGVHFIFLSMWPDSAARSWMETDLKNVSATTPVVIFTHDEPQSESKHFSNPNAPYDINATDKFENQLVDRFADSNKINDASGNAVPAVIEQRALVAFLKNHRNIVAYFHGNDHINGAFTYSGPDNDISLNVFSVDSPMKGTVSVADPTKLTFKVVAVDAAAQKMTVRDYQWNTRTWGASTTVSLAPRTN